MHRKAGYIAVAFDASYQGQSEGMPRNTDKPQNRVEDIHGTVDFIVNYKGVGRGDTGYSAVSQKDAQTYSCVGTSDGIANWRTMQSRLQSLEALGIPTEFHAYEGLSHGFGIGTSTVVEGWINDAAAFWEAQCE